jgi:hypothetical protein
MQKPWQNPTMLRHFHAAASILWLIMIPISIVTPLKDSVPFLVGISLWALVGAHWAAWQAARAEEQPVPVGKRSDTMGS